MPVDETTPSPAQDRRQDVGRAAGEAGPPVGECVVAVAALLALIILVLTTPHLP